MSERPAGVTLSIDGVRQTVPEHWSVAVAILNRAQITDPSGRWEVRRSVGGERRGPLCGMGICFECRAAVDGRPHERTCQLPVREGMEIRTDG